MLVCLVLLCGALVFLFIVWFVSGWLFAACCLFLWVVYLTLLWMGYCDVCDFSVVGFGGYGNCEFVRLSGCGVIVLWWSVVLMGFAVYG